MGNPLFNQFGNQNNNINDFINQIMDFRKNFTGNAKQEVEKLLRSGQMSQQQFNQLSQIANQILPFLPK
jgi:BMFP domain-containing protein YqiC